MTKGNLLSISEFSQLTGIPRSKLIYYDQIGLFPPVVRGDNNYRYYSLQQIVVAHFISDMVSFGVPLKTMVKLIRERTPQTMLTLLQEEAQHIQVEIEKLQETQSLIQVMTALIGEGLAVDEDAVGVVRLASMRYTLGTENVYQDARNFYPAWLAFMTASQHQGLNIKFPVGGFFDTMERFLAKPQIPSKFYFVMPTGEDVRSGGHYLVAYARGFYGEPGNVANKMVRYAQEHHLQLTGPVFNTFLHDELSGTDPDRYLMQAAVHVTGYIKQRVRAT
jgi:DNA-binding transcriptional MerR regulator